MSRDPIDTYLAELRASLPRVLVSSRRLLAEVEDHLREAARDRGEAGAVAAFGSVGPLVRAAHAQAAGRLAVLAVAVLPVLWVLSYPVMEQALPPAPWLDGAMPAHLAWKQDAVLALVLLAAGAAAAAVATVAARGRGALPAVAVGLSALAAHAVLGTALALEWAEAVPGTPRWLVLLPAGELAGVIAATWLAQRALRIESAAAG